MSYLPASFVNFPQLGSGRCAAGNLFADLLSCSGLPLIARDYAQSVLSLREPSQTLVGTESIFVAGSQIKSQSLLY